MTDKKPTIEFAPGCFDDFDGTQDELQELIAHIHQMAENGTLFQESEPLTPDEEDAVWMMLAKKQEEKKQ
jgi:hypothetical protein